MRGELVALGREMRRGAGGRTSAWSAAPSCGGDDQRPGHWSLVERVGRARRLRRSRLVHQPVVLDPDIAPFDPAQRFADPGDPAFGDDQIGRPPAAAAEHRLDARPELDAIRPRPAWPWSAARRETAFRWRRSALSACAALPPSSIRAWRPSQRQMPNRLRTVRMTFCHSRLAWPVVMPSVEPGERADGEDDEAVAGDPAAEVGRGHQRGDGGGDGRDPGGDAIPWRR